MCVHSGSGAMGKVSKIVAAVVSVAVCYTVPNVHMWVLPPPVPCPVPVLSKR